MGTVQSVTIQLQAPGAMSPGQITTGYYIVRDDKIIMTYADGEPVTSDTGSVYEHVIRHGDNIVAIAGILTKQVRRELAGMTEAQEEFGRAINYPTAGVA